MNRRFIRFTRSSDSLARTIGRPHFASCGSSTRTLRVPRSSCRECLAANDYVLHGRGDPARILAGLHCWPWDTEEVLDLMRWMRQYNIASTHRTRVTFGGFDAQF